MKVSFNQEILIITIDRILYIDIVGDIRENNNYYHLGKIRETLFEKIYLNPKIYFICLIIFNCWKRNKLKLL